MRLSIDVDRTRVVERELIGMAARTVDLAPAMRDIREIVYESEKKMFATEGAHGGTAWQPPSVEWTRFKTNHGLDTRTEQATGDLRASLTGRRRGSYSRAGKSSLTVGTTIPYAQYARKRNPLVSPTELERRRMVKTVQSFIVSTDRSRPKITV